MEAPGVFHSRFGIVNGAGARNDQKTFVLSVEDGPDGVTALRDESGLLITAFDFGKDKGRCGKGDVLDNMKIGDLRRSVHGAES